MPSGALADGDVDLLARDFSCDSYSLFPELRYWFHLLSLRAPVGRTGLYWNNATAQSLFVQSRLTHGETFVDVGAA